MAIVSRLLLNHPALGTAGGAGLHAQVEALYQKLGDAVATRWYQLTDFDQAETVDLEHNYDTDIANIRYDIYVFTGGQWVLITPNTSPALSDFSVVEKTGFEDTVLQITNNTAGDNLLAAVVLNNDPLYLQQGDVKDFDTTGIVNGQVPVWDNTLKKFVPGSSGINGFTKSVVTSPTKPGEYATLAAALAAAVAGDSILVTINQSIAGDLSLSVPNVRLAWAPNAVLTLTGALTNGVTLAAAGIYLESLRLKLEPTGAQARGINIDAANCNVGGDLELNTAQVLTDAVHITASGTRALVSVRIIPTLGTITNGATNNDGASKVDVWG